MDHEVEERMNRINEIIRAGKLDADCDLQNLLSYYAQLRKSGNGELRVKLVNGKLKIKGVTYIDPR
jgi:hypothetical protein